MNTSESKKLQYICTANSLERHECIAEEKGMRTTKHWQPLRDKTMKTMVSKRPSVFQCSQRKIIKSSYIICLGSCSMTDQLRKNLLKYNIAVAYTLKMQNIQFSIRMKQKNDKRLPLTASSDLNLVGEAKCSTDLLNLLFIEPLNQNLFIHRKRLRKCD